MAVEAQSDTDVLLDRLRPVLAAEASPADLDHLVICPGPGRRRSLLYFVGVAGDSVPYRWVVKQPRSTIQQVDLASPLSASDQYQALVRLHRSLGDAAVRAPRPLGYLPELDAFLMEYVSGRPITDLIGPGALRGESLLRGVGDAAEVLRQVHSAHPTRREEIDLAAVESRMLARARRLLGDAGLPRRERWFSPTLRSGTVSGSTVLLHGDFAPENVILSPTGLYCLDPDLIRRGCPEHDVVRFLVMLFDAPFFVAGAGLRPVQDLRRRAARWFLTAYYGTGRRPGVLRPLMLAGLAARWVARDAALTERAPRLEPCRRALLRHHFTRLLDETSASSWPTSSR